jgi:hypothetical protein
VGGRLGGIAAVGGVCGSGLTLSSAGRGAAVRLTAGRGRSWAAGLAVMATTVTVNDVLDGRVVLDLQCLDRVYLDAYVPGCRSAGRSSAS